jgi:NADH-quinone oxidoreductase subunit L
MIGALTLLLAALSAVTQRDIKRVLAYSTISQIGYMFLALGVGAWSAAIFHFMTHAFFKSLLFLAAGTVIISLNQEHDMLKMGGLRKELPTTFWTFLIGAASLAGLPLVTAGFYSKDLILWNAWSSAAGSPWLWAAGLAGVLLTGIYAFRMVFLIFYGNPKPATKALLPLPKPGVLLRLPLIVLAVLSVVGGWVELPRTLGNLPLFSDLLQAALPITPETLGVGAERLAQVIAAVAALGGVLIAYWLYMRRPQSVIRWGQSTAGSLLTRLWFSGWGFDWLYDRVFVRPFVWLARTGKDDVVDVPYLGLAWLAQALHRLLSRTQTGRVRAYAVGILVGAVIIIALVVSL